MVVRRPDISGIMNLNERFTLRFIAVFLSAGVFGWCGQLLHTSDPSHFQHMTDSEFRAYYSRMHDGSFVSYFLAFVVAGGLFVVMVDLIAFALRYVWNKLEQKKPVA